jgi:hypothetical protein
MLSSSLRHNWLLKDGNYCHRYAHTVAYTLALSSFAYYKQALRAVRCIVHAECGRATAHTAL